MKTSVRIVKYESQVVKPNPAGNTVDLYFQLNDMPLDEILSNNASTGQNQECLSISCLHLQSVFLKYFALVKNTLIRLEQNVYTIGLCMGHACNCFNSSW